MKKNGYYHILRVKADASAGEIETSYQRIKSACSEEENSLDEEEAELLEEAHRILTDEGLRRLYDEEQAKRPMSIEELNEKVDRDARKMHPRNNIMVLFDDFMTKDSRGEQKLAWEFFGPVIAGLLFLLALGRIR